MIGPTKLLSKGIFVLGKFVLKYLWIIITLAIIIPGMVSSINESVEQKNARIFFHYLGTTIVSSDEGIYEAVQDLEFEPPKKDGFAEKIGYYADFGIYLMKNLWKNLWMMLFWFFLIFKLEKFFLGNDSKSLRAFFWAIVTMTALQLIVYGIPFKGLFALGKFVVEVVTSI